jgi:hypothetical protein
MAAWSARGEAARDRNVSRIVKRNDEGNRVMRQELGMRCMVEDPEDVKRFCPE